MTYPRCTSTLTPFLFLRRSASPFPPSTTQTSLPPGRCRSFYLRRRDRWRKWKQLWKNRMSAVRVSATKKSYEERELKKAYRERKDELEEIRRNEEKRKRREEMKKKEENIMRSGTKLQRISIPNTLKKLAKSKQRKLLKVVPDEVPNTGKGHK